LQLRQCLSLSSSKDPFVVVLLKLYLYSRHCRVSWYRSKRKGVLVHSRQNWRKAKRRTV
jgi:hypothetical protein